MPICFLHTTGDCRTQNPPGLQQILIQTLDLTSSCSDKFVTGKVVQKGPLVCSDNGSYILKTVIQEIEPQQNLPPDPASIGAILFGALAKDFSEAVSEEDVVLMAGFTLAHSPTAHKDGLHSCNLQLGGDVAHIYVCPAPPPNPRPVPSSTDGPAGPTVPAAESSRPKYTYVTLNKLKPGVVVNVYGVVTFFKQPFRTKGTDYCSTLKITDPSDVTVACSIFTGNLEDHPKVFKIGDIVRLHRVKTQVFNGSISLMTSLGFSAMVFDGTVDSPLIPRTISKTFHFSEQDRQIVERLRGWAAGQAVLLAPAGIRLADVQPRMYFDFTCQLLAKAEMDRNCTLLKVWDGTRCSHPLLNVFVEPEALEGSVTVPGCRENFIANVLVFDNHVEVAQGLKPGSYLRIYNLHAVPQTVPAGSPSKKSEHLCFHLHGGTSYGRGLRVLPKDSPDLQELQRALELVSASSLGDQEEDSLMDVWATPPESLGEDHEDVTERTCDHALQQVTLSCVRNSTPLQMFHVRVQLKTFQPQRLYQCLKLHCPQCRALRDIPDDEAIASVFQEAISTMGFSSEPWVLTGFLDSLDLGRKIAVHLPSDSQGHQNDLLFLEGATLEEVCRIAKSQRSVVPVRLCEDRMTLLDYSVPFIFRGPVRHYGCRDCSHLKCLEPISVEVEKLSESRVAEALGVQLLRYVLLMKLELEDRSGSLEALLWNDAEKFFGVSASDTATNQELQDKIQHTMDTLCPPGSTMATRPWLDLCLEAYPVEDVGHSAVCYQVINTKTRCQQ